MEGHRRLRLDGAARYPRVHDHGRPNERGHSLPRNRYRRLAVTSRRGGTIAVQDKAIAVKQDAALAAGGNDERSSAFDLGAVPSVAVQDTRGATEAASDPVHACTTLKDSKTVWFKVTAPDAGTLRFSFANRRFDNGADSGTVLTVYPLVGGVAGGELGCSLTPQATNGITTRNPPITATK